MEIDWSYGQAPIILIWEYKYYIWCKVSILATHAPFKHLDNNNNNNK